jgi:hypothetical protein
MYIPTTLLWKVKPFAATWQNTFSSCLNSEHYIEFLFELATILHWKGHSFIKSYQLACSFIYASGSTIFMASVAFQFCFLYFVCWCVIQLMNRFRPPYRTRLYFAFRSYHITFDIIIAVIIILTPHYRTPSLSFFAQSIRLYKNSL